ncbi:unnamed protein product [Staurois parvus]|uniref:Uncharacterized protein n=1 Tax=Staurois parvus TaxID=386267 RepID=A0ABN9DC50_9NEOB|nr:unnamed protein product [Staurois parvus]
MSCQYAPACNDFLWCALTQGPHDPLFPGGPMSCQSAPVPYYLFYRIFTVCFDTGAP